MLEVTLQILLLNYHKSSLIHHRDTDSLRVAHLQFRLLGFAVFEIVAVESCLVTLLQHREIQFESERSTCGIIACNVPRFTMPAGKHTILTGITIDEHRLVPSGRHVPKEIHADGRSRSTGCVVIDS